MVPLVNYSLRRLLAGGGFLEIRFQTEVHLSTNDVDIKKGKVSNKIAKSDLLSV